MNETKSHSERPIHNTRNTAINLSLISLKRAIALCDGEPSRELQREVRDALIETRGILKLAVAEPATTTPTQSVEIWGSAYLPPPDDYELCGARELPPNSVVRDGKVISPLKPGSYFHDGTLWEPIGE